MTPSTVRELQPGDAEACDGIIQTLPYFFGQAAGVADCAAAVRSQRGLVAVDPSGRIVGFLTHSSHHPGSAEITWMAVHHAERRQGVGRSLLEELEGRLAQEGIGVMFAITVGPLNAWGPDSPGIILVRATKAGGA